MSKKKINIAIVVHRTPPTPKQADAQHKLSAKLFNFAVSCAKTKTEGKIEKS